MRIVRFLKFDEKTGEYVRIKKPIHPNDGIIIDFILRSRNDESEVVDDPLLAVPEPEVKRCSEDNNDTVNEVSEAEFELVEKLLKETGIEGYSLSYPSENFPDLFPLKRIFQAHCPLCDREYTSENRYIK